MMQTRRRSLKEAVINVAIGYSINFTANLAILPLFGFPITIKQNLALGAIFTAISIARTYCVRRLFNRKDGETSLPVTGGPPRPRTTPPRRP